MNGDNRLLADRPPGVEEHEAMANVLSYTVGLGLAIVATIASFVVAQTSLLWPPGISVGLIVLALAQIGVHLVFFLHLGSGPDDTNNILALAFGIGRDRNLALEINQDLALSLRGWVQPRGESAAGRIKRQPGGQQWDQIHPFHVEHTLLPGWDQTNDDTCLFSGQRIDFGARPRPSYSVF